MISKTKIKKHRKAIFVVVYRKNPDKNNIEYILLKRKLHWKGWEFPKGGVDEGEELIHAAKREAKEETGQKIINLKKYNISGKYKYDRLLKDRPKYMGQTYSLFAAEAAYPIIKPRLDKKEHSSYVWLDFNSAHRKLKWKNQKKCLKIINRDLNKI